jgi:hypothetical protein
MGLMRVGDLDGAAQAYRAALIPSKMNDPYGEALGSWNLGDVLINKMSVSRVVELLYKIR